jgi:hypothetical protein
MVSVAAATCLEADAAATAAVIMGDRAPAWLDDLKLPARLVDESGGVRFADDINVHVLLHRDRKFANSFDSVWDGGSSEVLTPG